MKKRMIGAVLALCLCLSLCACGGSEDAGYKRFGSLGSQELCVAFREGDPLRDIVTAGLMTLQNENVLAPIAVKWLGNREITIPASAEMGAWLENQPQRELIVGYYKGARPLCFEENGVVQGYDAEVFMALCARLGWYPRFQAIDRGQADVELASGNVDCVVGFGSLEKPKSGLSYSPAYLTEKFVYVSKGAVSREGQLKDKVLGVMGNSVSGKKLEEDEKLLKKLGSLLVLSGEDECFAALSAGKCDAILVGSLAADSYIG